MTKWIMAIAVVVVAGAGAWWYFSRPASQPQVEQTSTQPQDQSGMSAGNDSSNAALAQDTAAIDAQMQGLDSDSAAADGSMSDQAVSQAY